MEKKKIVFYITLAMTLFACSLSGGNGEVNSEPSSSTSGNGDGSSGLYSQPGPETIDLTAQALYAHSPNYTSQLLMVNEGKMVDGSAITQNIEINSDIQTQPTEGQHVTIKSQLSTQSQATLLETTILAGQSYTYSSDAGCFIFPFDPSQGDPFEDFFQVEDNFINEASRVETGVEINGFMTDRYEITEANIDPADENFDSDFTLLEGSLYVAREGGFVTRRYFKGITAAAFSDQFDPNAETQVTFTFNYIPIEGALGITPPDGCADQLTQGSEFPTMDDATKVSSYPGGLFYESSHTLDEVLDFYRTEMATEGWTLTDDSRLGSFARLTFTKDGRSVNVLPLQNGPIVAVTIEEE